MCIRGQGIDYFEQANGFSSKLNSGEQMMGWLGGKTNGGMVGIVDLGGRKGRRVRWFGKRG